MELFVFQLTSGSSGPSRLAARTRAGILQEIEAVNERIQLCEGDTILCASAISHSYGLVGGLLAPLSIGASVVLSPEPSQVSNLVHAAKPSVLFGLASTYIQLLSRVDRSALAPLRLALSAGAALPFGLYEEVLSRFQLPIRQDYGTTETGTISIDFDRAPAPHSVGHVLPHLDVRLSAPRNARLEGFERGEIQVRSPAVTPGYLEQGVLIPATDEEGWYGTRDLGGWDADGRLLVGRRVRDPVLVAGVSVPLEEVERALARLPGVRDVVALQALDVLGGSIIKAIVVAPELDFETVSRWSHDHLAPTHQPSSIELRSELPRSPAGKILHKYLVNSA